MIEPFTQDLSKLWGDGAPVDTPDSHVQQLRDWVAGYLSQPNAELGREGPVCPFARPSTNRDLLWFAIVGGETPSFPAVVAALRELGERFPSLPPENGSDNLLKAALIIFPDLADLSFIDDVQQTLKPDFVEAGLMIGQFYEGCAEPGLWNPAFRPLQSPLPLIAIRYMVSSDFPFLNTTAAWVESYLRHFAPTVPSPVRSALAGQFGPCEFH